MYKERLSTQKRASSNGIEIPESGVIKPTINILSHTNYYILYCNGITNIHLECHRWEVFPAGTYCYVTGKSHPNCKSKGPS